MSSLLLLLFLSQAPADGPEQSPVFVLRSADGSTVTGTLDKWNEDGNLTLADRPFKMADVLHVRRKDRLLPSFPTGEQAFLANGDCIPGVVQEISRGRVTVRTALGEEQTLVIPQTALALVWFKEPAETEDAELTRRRLLGEKRSRDVVYLSNGDLLEGAVNTLDKPLEKGKATLAMEIGRRTSKVDRANVSVIAFGNQLARDPKPKETYARIVLTNGGRLSVQALRLLGSRLIGKTLYGEEIRIPIDLVAGIDILQGRAVYLSDLTAKEYRHTPFLSVSWPLVHDGSVAGRELRLGGQTFNKGLGLHSQAEVTYELGGSFSRFESLVGLDDQTGKEGRATIAVHVDGKAQPLGWFRAEEELRWQKGPVRVQVNVTKARTLKLIVGYGARGSAWDDVNWVDALLVK